MSLILALLATTIRGAPVLESHASGGGLASESRSQAATPDPFAAAKKAQKAGDAKGAEKLYREALAGAEKSRDQTKLAEALQGLAEVLDGLHQNAEGLPLAVREIPIRENLGNQLNLGRALYLAGDLANGLGQLDMAKDFDSRALAIFEKLGVQQFIGDDLSNLGNVYYAAGQFDKALGSYSRALGIFERLGNQDDIVRGLLGVGNISLTLGQFQRALDSFSRALSIKEKQGKPQGIADSLNNLGSAYFSLGQFAKAMDDDSRAQAIVEKLGNPQDIANSLLYVGNVYNDLGQFDKAIDCYSGALSVYEKLGNQMYIAGSLNNLGRVYASLGQYEKALDFHSRTLAIFEKLGNPLYISKSLGNVGNAYESLGQFDKAMDYFSRSLAICEKLGSPQGIADTLLMIGTVHHSLGQFDKATGYYLRALAIQEKLGDPQEVAGTLRDLGTIYHSLGQFEKALDFHSRALAIYEKIENARDIAGSLNNLGDVYYSLARLDKADESYARSLNLFEELSHQVGNPSDLAEFQQANEGSLEARYARLRLKQGKPQEALEMADRARGFALSRQVALNAESLSAILKPDDLAALKAARQKAVSASGALRTVMQNLESAPDTARAALEKVKADKKKDLDDAERQYTLLRDSLYARNPAFKLIAGDNPRSGARLVQLGRQDPDSLFIEFSLVDDELIVYAVAGAEGLKTYEIKLKEKDLDAAVVALTTAIQTDDKSEEQASKALYAMVLSPLEKDGLMGAKYKHLMIVPDGPLLEVPFAALIDGQGKCLIDTHSVANSVSLGVLTWDITPRDPTENMLVIADPMAKGGARISLSRGATFGALPGAQQEGRELQALVPLSTALIGDEAREAGIKAEAGKYALLHFATHGTLNSTQEMLSALVLAPEDPAQSQEDGFLEAREIIGLPLSAQLAVLSACNSGEGQKRGEEGLRGLAWAFRAAGVPAIVASKWEVDDAATRRIMVRFYEELLKPGTRKDDALQVAILAEMKFQESLGPERSVEVTGHVNSGQRSPAYYWAAFQLIGDPSPLKPLPRK